MKIFYFISFLFVIHVSAQSLSNGKIVYQQTYTNFLGTQNSLFNLYFDKNQSLYIKDKNIDETQSNWNEEYAITISEKSSSSPFYYREFNENEVIYNGKTPINQYIVRDNSIHLDWKIYNETKLIGSYETRKASTTFRGRNYTAWFTDKIPVDFGPYKFYGLPGLILEIYDDQNVYKAYATEIKINSDNIDMNTILEEIDLNVEYTYTEFQDKRCDDAIHNTKRIMAKMGRNVSNIGEIKIGSEENIEVDVKECSKH